MLSEHFDTYEVSVNVECLLSPNLWAFHFHEITFEVGNVECTESASYLCYSYRSHSSCTNPPIFEGPIPHKIKPCNKHSVRKQTLLGISFKSRKRFYIKCYSAEMNMNSHLPNLGFPHVAFVFQSPAPFSRDTFNTDDMFSLFHDLHLSTDIFTLTILMNSSMSFITPLIYNISVFNQINSQIKFPWCTYN